MMDAQNFAYWLNGFAELSGDNPPTKAQWKSIKEHLALVFTKVTPTKVTPTKVTPPLGPNRPGDIIPADVWNKWVIPISPKCTSGA